jgi:hypothetical protein
MGGRLSCFSVKSRKLEERTLEGGFRGFFWGLILSLLLLLTLPRPAQFLTPADIGKGGRRRTNEMLVVYCREQGQARGGRARRW